METLQTSANEDWRGADNNVNALPTDWGILTADFWLDERLSHVRERRFAIVIAWRSSRLFHAIDFIWKSQ